MDAKRPGSGAAGRGWPSETEEIGLEDVEIIEDGVEMIGDDEPTPPGGTRPPGGPAVSPKGGKNRLGAGFDAALAKALGEDTARDLAVLKKKRKTNRRRLPHDEPDPEAMMNRPIEASGEVQLFDAAALVKKEQVPADSDGGVQVSADVGLGEGTEGTARIQRPKELEGALPPPVGMSSKAKMGILISVAAAIVLGGGVFGLVFWSKSKSAKNKKELERKMKLWKLRRKLSKISVRPMVPGKCPPAMVWIGWEKEGKGPGFCVDRFEFPNEKGRRPVMVPDHKKAVELCWERGKRLCTREEWRRVCGGKAKVRFPYGATYHPSKCPTRPPKSEVVPVQSSGSWSGCVSREKVFDLSGNMAEWVHEGVLVGGSGGLTGDQTSCTAEGGGGSSVYYGTRCCLSPIAGKR